MFKNHASGRIILKSSLIFSFKIGLLSGISDSSRAAHPETLEENRVSVQSILKLLMKIALVCGAFIACSELPPDKAKAQLQQALYKTKPTFFLARQLGSVPAPPSQMEEAA